jgi:hypothetical protein
MIYNGTGKPVLFQPSRPDLARDVGLYACTITFARYLACAMTHLGQGFQRSLDIAVRCSSIALYVRDDRARSVFFFKPQQFEKCHYCSRKSKAPANSSFFLRWGFVFLLFPWLNRHQRL